MYIPERDANGNLIIKTTPFASKADSTGKFFRRTWGKKGILPAHDGINAGSLLIELIIPYNKAKINRMEILWCPENVICDLEVYDTPTGLIQLSMGVPTELVMPSKMLNQFAFQTCVAKDYHNDESHYDADLIKDMKIECHLTNYSNVSKEVGVNFHLHEVK